MMTQRAFKFVPAPGDAVCFARMGMPLNWRRIARRASRLQLNNLLQAADEEARKNLLSGGILWRRHFLDAAMFEEIRAAAKRQGRALKRDARAAGRKRLSGALLLSCTPQGRRAQKVLSELSDRLRAWEAMSLCG